MKKGVSSGQARDEQLRQLMANSVEASALVHDELVNFKENAKSYAESSDKFAKSARIIAIVSLVVSLLAIGVSIWKSNQ